MKKCLVALIAFSLIHATAAYGAARGEAVTGGGILYTKPVKSVLFTHKSHGTDQRLSCVRCHNGLFEMEALKVQEKKDFNMESFYQGRYCGICHNGKAAFAANTQCARCHLRVKGTGPQRDMPAFKAPESLGQADRRIRFNHEKHTRLTKCSACHPGLFKIKKGANKITQADHGQQKYCFVCHDGKKSFSWNNCSRCHKDRRAPAAAQQGPGPLTYQVQGAGPVNFVHKSHGSFACDTCHPKLFTMKKGGSKMTMSDMYQGKSCGACHDGKKAFRAMECAKCHKGN